VPITILEAESYSLPIISTKVGGIPEIVNDGENGILIEPGDKQAMYDAIIKLMRDKDLAKEMGQKSVHFTCEHLPDYVENQLTTLYTELLTE
jgi:glycosyltransferase involved in cell wall biosynthesis